MNSIDIIHKIYNFSNLSNKLQLIQLNQETLSILQPEMTKLKYLHSIKKDKQCKGKIIFNGFDNKQCRMKRRTDSIYCPLCAYISF